MDLTTLGLAKKYANEKVKEAVFDGAKVVLDNTLTEAGCAAEAQTVGNRIKEVEVKIPSFDKADVGQLFIVKAVDENGKPTEWEAVDTPKIPDNCLRYQIVDEIPTDQEEGVLYIVQIS